MLEKINNGVSACKRIYFCCRFLAVETPTPSASSVQLFSLTSTPKPAPQNTSAQPTPQFSIRKPAAVVGEQI